MVDWIKMSLCRWKLFHYSLPLTEPLYLLGHKMHERTGLILRLHDENDGTSVGDNYGEGEIAPLPGMHPETLSEAENQIGDYLSGNSLPATCSAALFGSVNFGLDMALRTMFQSPNVSKFHSFKETAGNDPKPSKIDFTGQIFPVNGLAVGSGTVLEMECEELRNGGFKAVKLKVGQLTIMQDIERVRLARKILGDEIALRLDANRAWEWEGALKFAEAVQDFNIEYCEEPLLDSNKLEQLHLQTGMPLALDETLWYAPTPKSDTPAKHVSLSGIRALILKPSILGGWNNTKMWIEHAQKNGIHCVLSSCFESGLGLNWIAFMANELLSEKFPAGLDTSKWFEQDLIEPRFLIQNGNYVFPDSWPKSKDTFLEIISEGTCEIGDLD
jgi:O-succinylbenzoate synthase